ncbi:threonine aldolase family protein [Pseudomarimonas salicorniae]|uniref:L-threonine aldolase n=1 Tax=Pseudomarimonas salicorniae TaxID=2933270 RepID=A0ABT0GDN0_9GAMM|nr:low specificity L-threonine aldolase [Lysobacter sp. CAU 1642]MCK7592656.1 low specificity L-threonine aldolase [Lysobacter sp. CAU 1642]
MQFASDNWAGVAEPVMAALQHANAGLAPAYGGDDLTRAVERRFAEVFDHEVALFMVSTGGAANALALSALSPPWGMVVCHAESHIQMDECGGPEMFTGGAKLLPVPGPSAKLTVESVRAALRGFPERPPHGCPPSVLSLTQATECGTVYTPAELTALGALAREQGLRVHMDGARFANAVATLGCHPAEISWRAGVDVLCFGGTKNGAMAAEAVLFFDPGLARDFAFRRKRAGQLWSKQRFLAAQFEGLLAEDAWLQLAGQANAMARRLAEGLAAIDGVEIVHPCQINEVFVAFPDGVAEALRARGAAFYPWITPCDETGGRTQRLICSFASSADQVDAFLKATADCVAAARKA